MLLCSPVRADPIKPHFPTDVTMNKDAGRGNWLIVKLRSESGEELPFMVDTGCPRTILDKSLETQLGKQLGSMTIWTFGGKQETFIYAVPKLYWGSTQVMTGSNILVCDLKNMTAHAGEPIMGILGMDCLKNYCIQLDFEAGKMSFLDPNCAKAAELGKAFPLEFSEDGEGADTGVQPFIQRAGLLGGTCTNSIIDTGSNIDGDAERSMIKRHASGSYSGGFVQHVKHFLAIEGVVNRAVELPACVWEGNTYTNLIIGKAPSDSPSWIGLRFLARHLVTFDFPNGMMYLKQTSIGPILGK
jgi:hypothetical protein